MEATFFFFFKATLVATENPIPISHNSSSRHFLAQAAAEAARSPIAACLLLSGGLRNKLGQLIL